MGIAYIYFVYFIVCKLKGGHASLKLTIQCRSGIRFHLHGGSIPPISTDKSKAPEWVLLLLAAGEHARNRRTERA